jgi:uncharacterized membrane protein
VRGSVKSVGSSSSSEGCGVRGEYSGLEYEGAVTKSSSGSGTTFDFPFLLSFLLWFSALLAF